MSWLSDPANRRMERRTLPGELGEVSVIYFERYEGELLWGLSARFMVELLEALEI
jgi:hypothetical protein